MRILDRYVLREVLAPLITWVAFLFMLLTVMQFLRGSDVLLGSGVTGWDIAEIILDLGPHFLVMAIPVAFLLAILLGLGRLSEDRELTALESLGVSPTRVLAVPLLLAVVLGALLFALAARAEPRGLSAAKSLVAEVIKKNIVGDVKAGVFYEDLSDLTLYAEKVDKVSGQWTHVMLHDERDPHAPLLVLAKEGRVNPNGPGAALTLALSDGDVHRAEAAGSDYTQLRFQRADVAVGVQESITRKNRFRSPDEELTPGELLEEAASAKKHRKSPLPYLTAYQQRISTLFLPFAFALIGGPLAMSRTQAKGRGYLLTLGAYVLYYVLSRTFENWGDAGRLSPWVAGELANVLFGACGLVLLWRQAKQGRA